MKPFLTVADFKSESLLPMVGALLAHLHWPPIMIGKAVEHIGEPRTLFDRSPSFTFPAADVPASCKRRWLLLSSSVQSMLATVSA